MNYPQSLVSSVLREMEERTRRRQQLLERRVEEVCRRSEDIAAIQRQLEESAPRAIRRALESGEDPEQVMRAAARDHAKLIEQRAALLEGAGFTRGYLTLEPDCPACRDTGYCGLQLCRCVQRRCAALLAEQLSPLLGPDSGDFDHFSLAVYDDVPDPRTGVSPRRAAELNFDVCVDFARHFGRHRQNLLLHGPSGLGKTFLSSSIARAVAAQGFEVQYDTASHVVSAFERAKFEGEEEARRRTARYLGADLMILDDLGAEMTTAFTISALYDLINDRLLAGKSTVVSTNLSPSDLAGRYSPAIASRLTGSYTGLPFFGRDIRQKKRG